MVLGGENKVCCHENSPSVGLSTTHPTFNGLELPYAFRLALHN